MLRLSSSLVSSLCLQSDCTLRGDLLLKMEIAGHQVTFSKLGGAIHSEHVEHRVQMQTLSHPRQLLYDETNELMLMVDNSLQPTLTKSQQDTHTHTGRENLTDVIVFTQATCSHCFCCYLSTPAVCPPTQRLGQQGVTGASHATPDTAPSAEQTTHLAVKKKN